MFLTLVLVLAQVTATPASSASPAPTPSASPKPVHHELTLPIPPGWQRTESGRYNQWTSPDGISHFRVTALPVDAELRGPNAIDHVQKLFAQMSPGGTPTVTKVQACNGTQDAYKISGMLGPDSGAFMEIITGTDSDGLINYEALGKADPAILAAVDKICWP